MPADYAIVDANEAPDSYEGTRTPPRSRISGKPPARPLRAERTSAAGANHSRPFEPAADGGCERRPRPLGSSP